MIVDINAFIGKWPYWPIAATSPAEVSAQLAGWRIDRAAVCSTRSVFVDWQDGNCEVEQASRAENRFIPFACLGTLELSHALPRTGYDFEGYAARGFRGIRLYPQHHSYHPLFNSFAGNILEQVEMRRWPVLLPLRIIMNWGMPMLELGVIETLVERHPRVTWILAGINYLHELELAVTLLRRNANVHLETSCIMGYHAVAKLVEQCGSEQILFGSGAPVQHGGAGVAKIAKAKISEADRERLLGKNALRLLRLEEK